VREKGFSPGDRDRLVALLGRLGLPTQVPKEDGRPGWKELREAMTADKKTRDRIPRFVLAERLGAVAYGCEVPEGTLVDAFVTSNSENPSTVNH